MSFRSYLMSFLILICVTLSLAHAAGLPDQAKIKGGVVAVLGKIEPSTLTDLGINEKFIVQILLEDEADVDAARASIMEQGLYGPIAVDSWDGKSLPFIDNFVNLIITEEAIDVPADAIARALCPNGVFCQKGGSTDYLSESGLQGSMQDGWLLAKKPRPTNIDDWSHYLHNASNNAVARDTVVGPPRRQQWVGGPRYSRHHDKMSSFTALVSEGGRVYYVVDEAPAVSILFAAERSLIARDAFNGTTLWKRPIGKWFNHMHGLKSGPANLPRKLVAVDDRVFTTLSVGDPVVALDGATGETIKTYEGTAGTEEILCSEGKLFLQVNKNLATEQPKPVAERLVMCVDVATGKIDWSHACAIESSTLSVDDSRVIFLDKNTIACLDKKTGESLWKTEPVGEELKYKINVPPTLVLYDGIVLFADSQLAVVNRVWSVDKNDALTAFSAETGEKMWTVPHPLSGYMSAEDVLVIDGIVWVGETLSGYAKGKFKGYDVKTGEVIAEFDPERETYWFHHRCHRGKATVNYVMTSRNGIEYIDPKEQTWDINNWVRGACLYGVMPANGLTYAPQHPCACYLEAKLSGFNALAPGARATTASDAPQLVKGPAYANRSSADKAPTDWPTFRSDNSRSGRAAAPLPKKLKLAWATELGGKLSTSTVANGRIYVATIDDHTVHALDAKTGKQLWQFTAGGRVDSPPTYYKDRVLFGSADGHVYCLSADEGKLAWKFRAAPRDERLMSYGQLESVWPVHGSIMIEKDVAYFVAGRNMFLDGGLKLYRLNAATAEVLSCTNLTDTEEGTGKDMLSFSGQLNMPVSLPDILSCDEKYVYMHSQPFDFEGKRLPLKPWKYTKERPDGFNTPWHQEPEYAHLFSPTGFLDDTWWHRTYWVYGSRFIGGWAGWYHGGKSAPSARIMVMDDENVYGYGRKMKYYRWTVPIEHHLFSAVRDLAKVNPTDKPAPTRQHNWMADMPIFARAMLLSGDHLYLAGPADKVDEDVAARAMRDPKVLEQLAEQREIFTGAKGGSLMVVDNKSGEEVSEMQLDTIPVFDGMSAAGGRLYMSTVDGRVVCFEGEE